MKEEVVKVCPLTMPGFEKPCIKDRCMAWKPHGCAFVEGIQSIRYIGRGHY